MSEMQNKTWRILHRWTGLLLLGLVVFYCASGLLLNHRRDLSYFIARERSVAQVAAADAAPLHVLLDSYKEEIGRSDDPAVIRIKGDGRLEFLYGSHGKTTYIIDPEAGTMETVEKVYREPWTRLNNLHKVFKTGPLWLAVADLAGLGIFFLGLSGLLLSRLTSRDYLLIAGGLFLVAGPVLLP